jgi:hypothetical protein
MTFVSFDVILQDRGLTLRRGTGHWDRERAVMGNSKRFGD